LPTKYQTEQALVCHALDGASGSIVRVYEYLRNSQAEAERFGRRWIMPRQQTIADDLGRHLRTVSRAVAALVDRGLLAVQERYAKIKGQMRRISNRMRVMVTTAGVAARQGLVKAREAKLARNRSSTAMPTLFEALTGVRHSYDKSGASRNTDFLEKPIPDYSRDTVEATQALLRSLSASNRWRRP
jgi:DNA-binding transcriptional MocR family regulator